MLKETVRTAQLTVQGKLLAVQITIRREDEADIPRDAEGEDAANKGLASIIEALGCEEEYVESIHEAIKQRCARLQAQNLKPGSEAEIEELLVIHQLAAQLSALVGEGEAKDFAEELIATDTSQASD